LPKVLIARRATTFGKVYDINHFWEILTIVSLLNNLLGSSLAFIAPIIQIFDNSSTIRK